MLILVLGKGKTGTLVAEVARERGHGVRALDIKENQSASALTAPLSPASMSSSTSPLPKQPSKTCAPCSLLVPHRGWHDRLVFPADRDEGSRLQRGGGLLYGTNFSIGVQKLFRLTAELAQLDGYKFAIGETHHVSKLDAPSGTALTLKEIIQSVRPGIEIPVTSHRVGDAKGEHIVTASSEHDVLELRHDAYSRRGFALGAVRGAEWLAGKSGAWEFREIFDQL